MYAELGVMNVEAISVCACVCELLIPKMVTIAARLLMMIRDQVMVIFVLPRWLSVIVRVP